MTDARYADAGPDIPLAIRAEDAEDLRVLAALTQDAVLTAGGDLEAIGIVAGFAGYRHVWRPGLRSNLIYSFQRVDNDASLTGLLVNQAADSIRGNLIWSPVAGFDVGGELSFGRRELESGAEGDLTRVQLFAKYGF